MRRFARTPLLLLSLAPGLVASDNPRHASTRPTSSQPAGPSATDPARIECAGLRNVYRITDRLISGNSPEGDEGFRSLNELGVKTVISVDGIQPDVDRARKFGLRYIHLPFGYDGIPRRRILELARAVRDLPGPFYLHCHHGKHRGPTAAAAIHLCLDENCTVAMALAEMKRAGTDPHYTGLYAVPRTLERPTSAELDQVPADFLEVVKVSHRAQFMVEVDARWDNLNRIRAAGWKTPNDHADLDPPHEALQLVEQFREVARLAQIPERPEPFRAWLADAETQAAALERVLRLGAEKGAVDQQAADATLAKLGASCVQCHARYRDTPQDR